MVRKGFIHPGKEKFWRDVFRRFNKSGLPFKKFCEQEGLNEGSFQLAAPSMLAYVATSKFADHLPLNRLKGIFRRDGAES